MESSPDPEAAVALVVEDEPVTRHLVVRALQGLGCRAVLEARDGLEAQALLRERADVDLVLTDILMPGLDGLELLRWGREHAPDVIWIILSGLDTFDSAVDAIRLGAFDFLAKPPHVADLEVAVRNALERRSLLRERERLHAELRESNRQLVEKLREVEEKSELLQRDLERAEVIQRALLPAAPPAIEHFCVHTLYRPGHHVGGDLYDVSRIGERHLALYVADATGHGVTAAMLSVLFKHHLVLRDEKGNPIRPALVLQAANRALKEALSAPGLFLTAVYALLDTRDSGVTLASAGHPPVLHLPAAGKPRLIHRTGPALGLSADAHFGEEYFRMAPGDRLLLYSDGLNQGVAGTGEGQLSRLLRQHPQGGQEALAALLDGVDSTPAGEDRDDVTVMLLDVRAGASGFDNGVAKGAAAASSAAPTPPGVLFYGETEDATYLALRGRATWVHCSAFFDTAREIVGAGRPLVLDLSACDYLDSTCLGTVHQLVDNPEVQLQNVTQPVTALFEELGMVRVLDRIRQDDTPLPDLSPLATSPASGEAARRRILEAHEALSNLSERNRAAFAGVIDEIRGSAGAS